MTTEQLQEMAEAYAAAWTSGDPEAVVAFYADDGSIQINRGDVLKGREALLGMVSGFYAEFPDLKVYCDEFKSAGGHALFSWSLEGTHSETGNVVKCPGWEEWELNDEGKVKTSLGWFDADDYARQVEGR